MSRITVGPRRYNTVYCIREGKNSDLLEGKTDIWNQRNR